MALGGLRRPQFHKGQYGGPLGSYAPAAQLLAQAGRTQGAAMAGLGGNIAGAIEKYGLMKEKQKKQQANIKSTVNFLDSLANQDPDNVERYEVMKAQLNDPETPLTTRDELANQGIKNLTLSQQMLQRKGLTDAQAQLNSLNAEISQYKKRDARTTSELNAANAELAKRKESISERVFFEQGGAEGVAKGQVGDIENARKKVGQELTLVASQIANLNKKTEELGKLDPKDQATLKNLLAEADKLTAEAAKYRAETETMGILTGGDAESVPEQASVRPPVVPEAAGGDVAGVFKDTINSIFGVVGAPGFRERHQAIANLGALNAQLLPALTKAISSQGSVYTQEKMETILPQRGDSNVRMESKLESLVPILESKLGEARVVLQTAKAGEQKSRAVRILKTMPGIISALKESISQKNRRPANEEADRILGL